MFKQKFGEVSNFVNDAFFNDSNFRGIIIIVFARCVNIPRYKLNLWSLKRMLKKVT